MELKRVVITGLGAITPIGNTVQDYWNGLLGGVSGADRITLFDASKFKTQFACEVKGFDPVAYLDRKEARKVDRFTQLAIVSSDEAIKNAGITKDNVNPDRTGVIFSSGIGGLLTFQEEVMAYAKGDGTPRFNPFFIPKMILDIAAGHISMRHGFRGPNFAVVSACASSTHALIEAFHYIKLGKADVMVAGGSEAVVCDAGVAGFNAMKALSERNDDPKTASRPFDKDRDGFVMGEGSGAVILEELEHAIRRGATIYAEIAGAGATADAHHITAPHPEGLGALNVMRASLEEAGMKPEDIDYINVHGTSTPLGDIAETKAILGVFGDHAYDLNISSTKSMTGHLLGGAGGIESVFTVLALHHQKVPPTINLDNQDSECDLYYCANTARDVKIEFALKNNFGFGGTNGSLVFRRI